MCQVEGHLQSSSQWLSLVVVLLLDGWHDPVQQLIEQLLQHSYTVGEGILVSQTQLIHQLVVMSVLHPSVGCQPGSNPLSLSPFLSSLHIKNGHYLTSPEQEG